MTSPTVFGMNGSTLLAGGEAGPEAILPLASFYKELEGMLESRLDMSGLEKYLAKPAKPTNNPPGGSWAKTEPGSSQASMPMMAFPALTPKREKSSIA